MKFTICGQSMLPLFKPNDKVSLEMISASNVRIGDVVAYYDSESQIMVAHRVIRRVNGGLILKGDNNWKKDSVVIASSKVLIVYNIIKEKKTINLRSILGKSINKLFYLFSCVRVISLIYGRKKQYVKKIGGKKVSDEVYKKYIKFRAVNQNLNSSSNEYANDKRI